MDNLTHSLVGVLLSRAGVKRLAPRATVTLVLGANAPDIDLVALAWGDLAYLRHHRGLSHAMVGVPLLAALVATAVWLARGRRDWRRTYLAALAGVASHPLLDFTNTYGVRPWLPFSETWYSWDIVHIVDLWVWLALGLCVAGPSLGRLISGEIGAPAESGRAAAAAGLALLGAWWGARDVLHGRVTAMLEAHLYGGEPASAPERVAAFPSLANPLLWRGWVETERFHQVGPVDALEGFDPARGQVFYKPEDAAAVRAALGSRTGAEFAAFARYRMDMVDRQEDGYRVVFTDFRFQQARPRGFTCEILLDRELRVVGESFRY